MKPRRRRPGAALVEHWTSALAEALDEIAAFAFPARRGVGATGSGPLTTPHLAATPATTRWGTLPSESDVSVLIVDPGAQVTIDTVSHEGILEDQGRDPVAFFGRHGVAAADVLADAIDIAANAEHHPDDGPHVVTAPIAVRGARPGDWLAVRVDALARRADYGVISEAGHGRGALPGRFPALGAPVTSVFCRVDDQHGYLPLRLRFSRW